MNDYLEKDFEDFVNNIFYNSPQKEYSIALDKSDNVNSLFDKLKRIFYSALDILYDTSGDKTGLEYITPYDIKNLTKYFRSFGIDIKIKICHYYLVKNLESFICNFGIKYKISSDIKTLYPDVPEVKDLLEPNTFTSKKLSDRSLKIKTGDLYYFISFQEYL